MIGADGTMTAADTRMATGLLGPPTKADAAYLELRRRIVEGALEPGARIDQEVLAATLGVSTTPLREALRQLEAERLVLRSAHRQVLIAPLSRSEVQELYTVRFELDSLAVQLAAAQVTEQEIEAARATLSQQDSEDPLVQLVANRTFHRVLYEASRNPTLVHLLEWMWDRADRYRYVLLGDRHHAATAVDEHLELLQAVEDRDGDRAARLMREHLRQSVATLEQRLVESEQV